MALLQMAAETEIFFKNNWTDTTIQYQDTTFDYNGLTSWVSIKFFPTVNEKIGMDGTSSGRVASFGLCSIFCYHKKQKLSMKLADDVKAFFNGKELPLDIRVDIGQDKSTIDLDNGFYETRVNFEIAQYS